MGERSYEFGPFAFDMQRRLLRRHGSLVALGQKCSALLEALLAAKGKAVSKSELIEAAWQSRNIEESNLAVQIAALRKCLGRSKSGEEWIATVQRVGYQFVDHEKTEGALNSSNSLVAAPTIEERLSIAVLEFADISGNTEQGNLCTALTEELIIELTRWRFLSVQARPTPFRSRDLNINIEQAAHELKVRYIVQGNVRRLDRSVRIAVRLIDAEAGFHLWAERFCFELGDTFSIQDDLVQTIVSTLVGRIVVAAVERVNRRPPATLSASECVLQGNAISWDAPAGIPDAARLFGRAIAIDRGHGVAHAMLALMFQRRWHSSADNSDAPLNEAFRLAKRAVELEGDESTCFAILGLVSTFRQSYDFALQCMERAVEINPTNQWVAGDMGIALTYCEQPEAALTWFERAREIDPYFNPPWYSFCIGVTHMVLRRYRDAITAFEQVPVRSYQASAFMAGCHARLAETGQAAALAGECLNLRPKLRIGAFMAKEPFKSPAHAAHIAESLQMAGLPE